MALKVKVGDVYTDPKFGENNKGRYGFCTAKAEKGSDKIAIFFSNIDDIPDDTFAVEIVSIEDANISAKRVGENWYKNFGITAKVKAVEGGANPIDLAEGDVPF